MGRPGLACGDLGLVLGEGLSHVKAAEGRIEGPWVTVTLQQEQVAVPGRAHPVKGCWVLQCSAVSVQGVPGVGGSEVPVSNGYLPPLSWTPAASLVGDKAQHPGGSGQEGSTGSPQPLAQRKEKTQLGVGWWQWPWAPRQGGGRTSRLPSLRGTTRPWAIAAALQR